MEWYRTAEHYIDQQEWPATLKPVLSETGLKFEKENPIPPAGISIIPADWEPVESAHEDIIDSILFRSSAIKRDTVLQNAATMLGTSVLEPKPIPVVSRVFVYNPSSSRRPHSIAVTTESNIRRFTSLVLGALPQGVTLFKHTPYTRIYIYIAGDIWLWEGVVEVGLSVIATAVQLHVAEGILLCWNRDLRRYLMMILQPNKSVLDWEADFDKPNITQLFNEVNVNRILAYNSDTSLVFTMTVAAARIAVQMNGSVT